MDDKKVIDSENSGEQPNKEEKSTLATIIYGFVGVLIGLVLTAIAGFFALMGAAWGRPLRVNGKQVHAKLIKGNDWTRGEMPDTTNLDNATRDALEVLWLHDAQKEHASVPSFSRISWLLASVGAPADLLEWSHRAAIEEIEHTQLCFALAQGYSTSGISHTVKAMPELLSGGLDLKEDALLVLAKESLADGCQLEDFNADVASACAQVCEERVTRNVLKQIALEERSQAEFSWKLLEWTCQQRPNAIGNTIKKAIASLETYKRPTAMSWKIKRIVEKANQQLLLKHGRLQDEQWGEIWDNRLVETKIRLNKLQVSYETQEPSQRLG